MRFLVLMSVFLFSSEAFSQAEFVNENLQTDENETVIEKSWFENLNLEEPVFPPSPEQRGIASIEPSRKSHGVDSLGQLEVVKEIPYTYRWVSHHTMRARVLNEIEQDEIKAKETSKQ